MSMIFSRLEMGRDHHSLSQRECQDKVTTRDELIIDVAHGGEIEVDDEGGRGV